MGSASIWWNYFPVPFERKFPTNSLDISLHWSNWASLIWSMNPESISRVVVSGTPTPYTYHKLQEISSHPWLNGVKISTIIAAELFRYSKCFPPAQWTFYFLKSSAIKPKRPPQFWGKFTRNGSKWTASRLTCRWWNEL